MKKCTIVIIVLFNSFLGINMLYAATNPWTSKADFGGTAREFAVGFSIGDKGYIGTGSDGSDKKDFWEYDPAANTWTQKADIGITLKKAVGFSIGDKGYIVTGSSGYYLNNTLWEYDPATNTWTQKADFGGAGRSFAVGFSIGSKGYIGTGLASGTNLKDFWEYDPATNTWTQKADFGGAGRCFAVGFSIGSKGYIGTGCTFTNSSLTCYKDFWEYDPATNTWTQKADFGGTVRESAVGFSIGTKAYIGTGFDNSIDTKDLWEYDPIANTWTQKADFLGLGRAYAVGFSIASKGYIGTGESVALFKDFWEYDPTADLSDGGNTDDGNNNSSPHGGGGCGLPGNQSSLLFFTASIVLMGIFRFTRRRLNRKSARLP